MIKSVEEFIRLRESDNPQEYRRAINENADLRTWLDIIDKHPHMREWVVLNKTVPIEVLNILIIDDDPRVRSNVAMKNKLNSEMFEILAKDKNSSVRNRLVFNKKVPKHILLTLSNDAEDFIRKNATKRLQKIQE